MRGEKQMRKVLTVAVFAVAALLAGCTTRQEQQEEDMSVFCPGGRNCPADTSYSGFLIPESLMTASAQTAFYAAAEAAKQQAEAAEDTATPAAAPAQPEAALLQGRPTLCPGQGCQTNRSGLIWRTPGSGEIYCVPGVACATGVPPRFFGILCKENAQGRCADVPRGRRRR
jgi:hypothetical protein